MPSISPVAFVASVLVSATVFGVSLRLKRLIALSLCLTVSLSRLGPPSSDPTGVRVPSLWMSSMIPVRVGMREDARVERPVAGLAGSRNVAPTPGDDDREGGVSTAPRKSS